MLGRAVDRARFLNAVSTANGVTRYKLRRLLGKLKNGDLKPSEKIELSSYMMSEYGAWVTWDLESDGINPPFSFLSTDSPLQLREALGLDINDAAIHNLPMVAFAYESETVGTIHKPTTADAASGLRFRVRSPPPPAERDWYGLTVPWEENPRATSSSDERLFPPKRPEALHSPARFPVDVSCRFYPDLADA